MARKGQDTGTYKLDPDLVAAIYEIAEEYGLAPGAVLAALGLASLQKLKAGQLDLTKYMIKHPRSLKYEHTLDLEALKRDLLDSE